MIISSYRDMISEIQSRHQLVLCTSVEDSLLLTQINPLHMRQEFSSMEHMTRFERYCVFISKQLMQQLKHRPQNVRIVLHRQVPYVFNYNELITTTITMTLFFMCLNQRDFCMVKISDFVCEWNHTNWRMVMVHSQQSLSEWK